MDNDFATGYALGADSGNGSGNGANGGFWGGDGWWAIIIFAMIFGWGNGGFGGSNNAGGQGGADTRAAISEGFALNGLENGIIGLQGGLCDGFNSVNNSLMQGFNGVQTQLCNISAQNQACCCETQRIIERGFADANYNLATQSCETRQTIQNTTRDILENNNANTRAILDFLTQDKIAALQAENQTLKFQASQTAQNGYIDTVGNYIIARLQQPTPVPSYTVPAPYPYAAGNCCGC